MTTAHHPDPHSTAMGAPEGLERCPIMGTYAAPSIQFVEGSGSWLTDRDGKRYLDLLSGLAVTSLGHAHPAVSEAVAAQAQRLVHTSNLYATEHAAPVAQTLDRLLGGGGQVFFANSGAEANECAMKLARKWAGHGRYVVVSAYGSFHGRTMATLAATGQPAKHEPFAPMPEGYRHVAWGDLAHLESAIDETVAAVIIEPIQGEGGVHPAETEYLAGIRRLCDERNLLMILDEVQTGLGRTGEWFGFQHAGVAPDVVTMAKALGNGVPISACWARAEVASAFRPGDHGSTFGGNPLCSAAARATLEVMEDEDVPARAARAGALLRGGLAGLAGVAEVRGAGLLLAAELDGIDAGPVAADLLAAGVIVNAVTPTALRLAPSLLITDEEIAEAAARIGAVLDAHRAGAD